MHGEGFFCFTELHLQNGNNRNAVLQPCRHGSQYLFYGEMVLCCIVVAESSMNSNQLWF